MPPKLANAKRTKRSNPALKAGLDLMAQLGGIQVLGTAAQPYYYFPPAVRLTRGIERCSRCVDACGTNAACNVQPLTRITPTLWRARKCHYCTIYPAEMDGEQCSLEGRLYNFDMNERHLMPVNEAGDRIPLLKSELEISLATGAVAHSHCNGMTAPVTPPPEKEAVAVLPDVPQPSTPEAKSRDLVEPVTPPTATMSSFGLYTPVATPSLEKTESKSRELLPQALEVPSSPEPEKAPAKVEAVKPAEVTPAQQFLQRITPSPTTATTIIPVLPLAEPVSNSAETPAQQFLNRLATAPPPAPVVPVAAPAPAASSTATLSTPPASKPKSDHRPVALGLAPIWGNKPSFDREAPPTPKLSSFAPATPTASGAATPTLHRSHSFSAAAGVPAQLPIPISSHYSRAAPVAPVQEKEVDPLAQLTTSRRPTAVLAAVGDALHSELAVLDDISLAIAELKRLLAAKEEEHAAQLRKVDSYRCAIDDALTAIDEEQRSLRTMRARLANSLL